ncbi:hypothetical protein CRG98_048063, partial [Punica granatum]
LNERGPRRRRRSSRLEARGLLQAWSSGLGGGGGVLLLAVVAAIGCWLRKESNSVRFRFIHKTSTRLGSGAASSVGGASLCSLPPAISLKGSATSDSPIAACDSLPVLGANEAPLTVISSLSLCSAAVSRFSEAVFCN